MPFRTSDEIGTKILNSLGIDPTRVRAVTFVLAANSVPCVVVERMVEDHEAEEIHDILEEYVVVRVDEDAPAPQRNSPPGTFSEKNKEHRNEWNFAAPDTVCRTCGMKFANLEKF